MSAKYVLGGGLSGLVFSYYNPEYTVLTDSFGGFVDTKFGQAFVVLHETSEMLELFDDLGVNSFVKRLKIGYYDEDSGLRRSAGTDFARSYVEEKLPPEFQPGKDLELSAPGDEWRALFVDSSIVDELQRSVEDTKTGSVESIDEETIEFSLGESEMVAELDWDSIVSTLPAHVFARLCDENPSWDLEHHPTSYAEIPEVPDRYRDAAWNLLYTVDSDVSYHRVVRNMLSSNYFVETLGDTEFDDAISEITNPIGVIDDEDLDAPYDGISFLGRYAEWQHDVRIDHVVERAMRGEA